MGESRRRGKAERIHPPRGRIEGVGGVVGGGGRLGVRGRSDLAAQTG